MKALTVIAALPYPNRPRDRELWASQTAEVEICLKQIYKNICIYLFIYLYIHFPPSLVTWYSCKSIPLLHFCLTSCQIISFYLASPVKTHELILSVMTCHSFLVSRDRMQQLHACKACAMEITWASLHTHKQRRQTQTEMPWTTLALLSGAAKQETSPAHKHGPFTPFISGCHMFNVQSLTQWTPPSLWVYPSPKTSSGGKELM